MSIYYVYAKGAKDKQFRPINEKGVRGSKTDAEVFLTRDEAKAFVAEHESLLKPGAKMEVRKG
jgi:hypothetical protein